MKRGIVYKHGINDAKYTVKISELIDGKYKIVWECPVYCTWKDLLRRCYSESFRKQKPYYADVTMCEHWHKFSNFKRWFDKVTDGNYYAKDGKKLRLDKDLKIPKNKHYCPETCVLVPATVNNFILSGSRREDGLPRGVILAKKRNLYQVFCKDPFNRYSKFICESSDLIYCIKVYTDTKLKYLKDLYSQEYTNQDLYDILHYNIKNRLYE